MFSAEELEQHVKPYILNNRPLVKVSRRSRNYYINIPCAFDIETTTINLGTPDDPSYTGFMYIWMFAYSHIVIYGRTWEDFQNLLKFLKNTLHLNEQRRLVIYSHYLAFEFQHIQNFVKVENVFARQERQVIKMQCNQAFEFRCSYFLSNMSLEACIDKATTHRRFMKRSGDEYDYSINRTYNTGLTPSEFSYCYCDVRGLVEYLEELLKEDTIASIPLTSTGFIRREVRKAVLSNKDNKKEVEALRLTPREYVLCKTASRGGNSHASAYFSNELLEELGSDDRKSSYPAQMVVGDYPMTGFQEVTPNESNLFSYFGEYAMLIDVTFYDLQMKDIITIPYISLAKCTFAHDIIRDNGRITSAKMCSMVITDIDFDIIINHYDYSELEVTSIHVAKYGKLNKEFRTDLMDKFRIKTELETGDKLLYTKYKNKINAFFGMMLTDICSAEIEFVQRTCEWRKGEIDIQAMLDRYYASPKSFLSYQHGIWVTASARYELQLAIDAVGHDIVYTDTDSVKYINPDDHKSDIKALNERWLKKCEENDIAPYVDVRNKRTYIGVWEHEGSYANFKTLGAKKYAYTDKEDDSFHITVAGLNKTKGAKWLLDHGGFDAFKIGVEVPAGDSGRTAHTYNDHTKPYKLTVNGTKFTTGSNIGVTNVPYTFGISDDYFSYLLYMNTLKH